MTVSNDNGRQQTGTGLHGYPLARTALAVTIRYGNEIRGRRD